MFSSGREERSKSEELQNETKGAVKKNRRKGARDWKDLGNDNHKEQKNMPWRGKKLRNRRAGEFV